MAVRLNVTRIVRAVVRDAARKVPEFSHVKSSRVLVVAGEARRASWATVRPLGRVGGANGRPVVRVKGRQMLYVITLRPRFFRGATPEKRVETILHEMFHISRRFDGTLHSGRRHSQLRERFEARLGPLVRRYLDAMDPALYQALSASGPALARQWLEKPGLSTQRGARRSGRRVYTEKQLFVGPVEMITRRPTGRPRGVH
jgi:predicted metallopeptidase